MVTDVRVLTAFAVRRWNGALFSPRFRRETFPGWCRGTKGNVFFFYSSFSFIFVYWVVVLGFFWGGLIVLNIFFELS